MTEQNIENISDQQDQNLVPNEAPSDQSSSVNSDEVISKSRMNDIIHERTRQASQKAYERAKAEAQAERERERQSNGIGGMPQMDEAKLRSMMQEEFDRRAAKQLEEFERQSHQKRINDLANDYTAKIAAAKETHPDLFARQHELNELAMLVPFINETSEVAGISQHLLDNGGAFANLLVLSQQSPERVRRELKKIEASIKANDAARSREYPNEPLSQPTPSKNAMDNGSSSIEALKQQPWLRG